jgi:putative toxin-antitoxin system antitoxin component (TIGR02293 family)
MTAAEYLIDVLGGPRIFKVCRGRTIPTAAELRARINSGLPYSALESVRARFQLSLLEAAIVLHVPLRTLARRKEGRRLGADESDRLYRLARLGAHAVTVFGTEEKAATWLRRPNRALNNESPIRLLDTDIGARQVEDVLGRIEYGVVG